MTWPPRIVLLGIIAPIIVGVGGVHSDTSVGLAQIMPTRLSLRVPKPHYTNYAHRRYTNYRDHTAPYTDHPRKFFGPLGDQLLTGYEIYSWQEKRGVGSQYGSAIYKDINVFRPIE